jgi:hypothetical protein
VLTNAVAGHLRSDNCREQGWLLKKSVFLKKVENRLIENGQETGGNRL